MQIRILYFSQTGNTYKICKAITEALHQEGNQIQMIPLLEAKPDDFFNGDLLGIGTPCFSSKAPLPIMQFLYSLPQMKERKAFLFATCGGAPGRVLLDVAKGLRNKGLEVLAGTVFRGEVHHPAPILHGRFPGCPNKGDLERARVFARTLLAHLKSNTPDKLPKSFTHHLNPQWKFYEILGTIVSDSYLRFLLPEPKLAWEECNQCGSCSQECPSRNISLEPYPVLGKDCIRCYHCYNHCPRQAFLTNWKLSNPILWLFYNPTFIRWFGDLNLREDNCPSTKILNGE